MSAITVGQILIGPLLNEPVRAATVGSNVLDSWMVGLVGSQSEKLRKVTPSTADLKSLTIQNTTKSYNRDGQLVDRYYLFVDAPTQPI